MKAAVTGLDQGLDFAVGHELDEESARQIPFPRTPGTARY